MKVSEIVKKVYSGGTPNTRNADYWGGDAKWLSSGETSNDFIYDTEKKITDLGIKNSSTRLAHKGSIVIASAGQGHTRGQSAMLMTDTYINQSVICIEPDDEKVDGLFLYYYFKNNYDELRALSDGHSSRGSITTAMIKDLDLSLPSLYYQEEAARILFSIDKKIELNNAINKTLFSILKEYFKTVFMDSEERIRLCDLVTTTVGGDWGKERPDDIYVERVFCIRGADLPSMEHGDKGNAPRRFVKSNSLNKKQLAHDEIIVEISGGSPTQSTGRTAYISKSILDSYDAPLLCTNFCRAITPKNGKYAPFIYVLMKVLYEKGEFFNWENGTTGIKNLALNSFLNGYQAPKPSDKQIELFNGIFYTTIDIMANNSNESTRLAKIRDTILPNLISGKIDIKEVIHDAR